MVSNLSAQPHIGANAQVGANVNSQKNFARKPSTIYGRGCSGGRLKGRNVEQGVIPWQQHMNWDHCEVLALIVCKHKEYKTQKKIVDPKLFMIPIVQCGTKLLKNYRRCLKAIFQGMTSCARTKEFIEFKLQKTIRLS